MDGSIVYGDTVIYSNWVIMNLFIRRKTTLYSNTKRTNMKERHCQTDIYKKENIEIQKVENGVNDREKVEVFV